MPDKKKKPDNDPIDEETPTPVGDEPPKNDVPPIGDKQPPPEKDKRFV